jgi:tryptophan synthase alpha chain
MSRISETFDSLRRQRAGAYIPYVCAGDLGNGFTLDLIKGLCSSGADLIELGLPFSDPVADGLVIQGAMKRSLDAGFRVADVFKIVKEARSAGFEQPIVLMTYHNPVHKMRIAEFCHRAAGSDADGILVVDLPPEESGELDEESRSNDLDVIRLIAPSTSDERIKMIVSRASGFVYAVSVSGVTGERQGIPETAIPLIRRITAATELPVALGFGISRPEHAHSAFSAGASGVVEGSGLISLYQRQGDRSSGLESVMSHASAMKRSMTAHQ